MNTRLAVAEDPHNHFLVDVGARIPSLTKKKRSNRDGFAVSLNVKMSTDAVECGFDLIE